MLIEMAVGSSVSGSFFICWRIHAPLLSFPVAAIKRASLFRSGII